MMTAPRTSAQLEIGMPAIDVFWLNHSMAFLPDRLLARSDRSLTRLIVGGYALADSHVAGSASLVRKLSTSLAPLLMRSFAAV